MKVVKCSFIHKWTHGCSRKVYCPHGGAQGKVDFLFPREFWLGYITPTPYVKPGAVSVDDVAVCET